MYHRQKQWPEWLGTAEFAYNNKRHTTTRISPFEANYGLSLRMGFEGRRGKRFEAAEEFADRMKQVQEEVKAVLRKAQEMRKYADKKRREGVEFKVGDLVLLSIKELKWHIKGRRSEKLTERFVGPYKVKNTILGNAVELELPSTVMETLDSTELFMEDQTWLDYLWDFETRGINLDLPSDTD